MLVHSWAHVCSAHTGLSSPCLDAAVAARIVDIERERDRLFWLTTAFLGSRTKEASLSPPQLRGYFTLSRERPRGFFC